MSITGPGNLLSAIGSQYNFTSMTNSQLSTAAKDLESKGKISKDEAVELQIMACGGDSPHQWHPLFRSPILE